MAIERINDMRTLLYFFLFAYLGYFIAKLPRVLANKADSMQQRRQTQYRAPEQDATYIKRTPDAPSEDIDEQ